MRVLFGKGSELSNTKAVQRRAKCKLITQTTILRLIDVATDRGAKDRVKTYWNIYHCQNVLFTSDGKVFAPQCKSIVCLLLWSTQSTTNKKVLAHFRNLG